MSNVQVSYPPATTGVGVPAVVALSGTGVSQVKGNVYAVTLSVSASSHASSVAVTATLKDLAGTTQSVGSNPFNFASSDSPLTYSAAGFPSAGAWPLPIVSIGGTGDNGAQPVQITAGNATITAKKEGTAVVRVAWQVGNGVPPLRPDSPLPSLDGSTGALYADLVVTVVA